MIALWIFIYLSIRELNYGEKYDFCFIARGNSDENIVYITPFKEAFTLLNL